MSDSGASPTERMFIRQIEVPPGPPWDQRRAVRLEARHGAPLREEAVAWAIRRLSPWRPRAMGRFAVAYVRREDVTATPLTALVAGQDVAFRFARPWRERLQLRTFGLTAGLGLFAALTLAAAVEKAVTVRGTSETHLARLELNGRRWTRVLRHDREIAADQVLLRETGAEHSTFADLATDLFWLGQARAASATIDRVQWRRDEMRVVSESPGPPVLGSERLVEAVGRVAGAREWRIGARSPAIARQSMGRPSVVISSSDTARQSRSGT